MLSVDIRHSFDGFTLNAAFEAPPGVTALFGRSGSGKTTMVNAIAGLLRPQSGRIAVDGRLLSDSDANCFLPPHRRGIGYVFQEARLFPHLTVRQNLLYGRWFSGQGGADLPRIVEMLGIGHLLSRRPAALSGGERQRVALGRAILSNPRLLLMDEPLAALDQARKDEILPYLERLRDEIGLPILYVSHSPAEIARLATTVVMLDGGRVVTAGPASDVLSDPRMAPLFGSHEVAAIISAQVEAHVEDGLTRLRTSAGNILLPRVPVPPGGKLRLRIFAQDVMIALEKPVGISALNVLPVTIRDLTETEGSVMLRLDGGGEIMLAQITKRSALSLGLIAGNKVYAVLKAVSIAQ